jgi:uncharacterized protein
MRFLLALGVFALAALQSAAAAQTWYWCEPAQAYYPYVERCPAPWRLVDPSSVGSQPSRATQPSPLVGQPTPLLPTTPNRFPVLGDTLDDWCKTVQLPSSIAICSDRELRALTLERQQAFDEATARLNTEQQKTLLADQNSWVKSYAAACGLSQDFAPSLPLAPSVKECMAQAGRARIAYLRDATALGASPALSAPQPPSTAENGAPGKSTKTLTKTQPKALPRQQKSKRLQVTPLSRLETINTAVAIRIRISSTRGANPVRRGTRPSAATLHLQLQCQTR